MQNETIAAAERAFAIEMAKSAALQALLRYVPIEHLRFTWMLGYCSGRTDAFRDAQLLIGTPDKEPTNV